MPEKKLSELWAEYAQTQAYINLARRAGVPGYEIPQGPPKPMLDIFGKEQQIDGDLFQNSRIAILGMSGSGKTNSVAVLAEEFLRLGYPCLFLDTPEGEFISIARAYKVQVIDEEFPIGELVQGAMRGFRSFLLLQNAADEEYQEYCATLLSFLLKEGMRMKAAQLPQDVKVFIDESQRLVPEHGGGKAKKAVVDCMKRGRANRLSMHLATQRPQDVSKAALTQVSQRFLHRFTDPVDLDWVTRFCGRENADKSSTLKNGECLFIRENYESSRHRVRLRYTPHRSHTSSFADLVRYRAEIGKG